jgi:hypothetical protein
VTSTRRHFVVVALLLLHSAAAVSAGDKPLKAFAKDWEGRRVVLKSTLYTLVYDEVGRFGATRRGKVEGLTVATPVSGTYYRFPGLQGQAEILDSNPKTLVDRVATQYRRSKHLEIGTVQMVDPVMLVQYSSGTELVVRSVQADRECVRLVLHKSESGAETDPATSLTVQWPTALSNEFTERTLVEALVLQFVDVM